MRRFLPLCALLLAACEGAGPAPAQETTPERPTIVSLNPCADAILAEVTAPGQLLAISHYSKDPQASSMTARDAARFPATGGTVEEVLALDPDMVVASSFIDPATRAALDGLGIRVEMVDGMASVAQSLAQVRDLARLSGNDAAGKRLVARIENAIAEARGDGDPVEAALWQVGGIVPGDTALISDLLRLTGFASYGAMRGMQQADYLSLEQIVADPPELLLVAGSEAGQRHPVLDDMPTMRRADFDMQLVYCGGPTIVRAVERLAEIRDGAA